MCGQWYGAATVVDDATARGGLVIADRVGEKTAVRAALGVDGVIAHQTTLGSMLAGSTPGRAIAGGDYPQASVDMSAATPRVQVTIAVRWPCRLTDVCLMVRDAVTRDLDRLTGHRPSRVDVSVAAVVNIADIAATGDPRRGYTELPPVPPAAWETDPALDDADADARPDAGRQEVQR